MIYRIALKTVTYERNQSTRDRERGSEPIARKERSLENIVVEMLRSKENWLTVSSAFVKIQNELLKEVRTRKAQVFMGETPLREVSPKWWSNGLRLERPELVFSR